MSKLSDLSTKALYSELGRRRRAKRKRYPVTCTCGKCLTCRNRAWQRAYRQRRAKGKH